MVETWDPTWFCLDGQPLTCAGAPNFSGADAPQILAELGYSQGDILGLKQSRAVVPTNPNPNPHPHPHPTQVITAAEFHPQQPNTLVYSSSKGVVRLCDLREKALCDRGGGKVFEQPALP